MHTGVYDGTEARLTSAPHMGMYEVLVPEDLHHSVVWLLLFRDSASFVAGAGQHCKLE